MVLLLKFSLNYVFLDCWFLFIKYGLLKNEPNKITLVSKLSPGKLLEETIQFTRKSS